MPGLARFEVTPLAWRLAFLYAALFLVVGCYLPYMPVWLHWRDLAEAADHHHASDRGRGGERRAQRRPRLRTGAALGLRQLHPGKLRRRARHRPGRRCLGDADAGDRHVSNDHWRLRLAARHYERGLAKSARASPHQPRRRGQARAFTVVPVVPARGEHDPGEPRPLLCLRHAALAQGFADGTIGALWALGVIAEIALFAVSG